MKIAAAALGFFLLQTAAFADVIENKNGQTLEGTITAENEQAVTLEVDGLELTLPRGEIAAIRRGRAPNKPKASPRALKDAVERSAAAPAEEAPVEAAPPESSEGAVDLSRLERPVIVFDERDWKLVSQDVKNQVVMAQFLPVGDNLRDWSELVSAQLYIGLRTEPRYYAQYVKEKTASTCPGTQLRTVRETPYDVTYEWSVKGCADIPDQSEIARVILGGDGLHILRYAMKLGEMPADNRAKWIGCLEASQIVKP